MPDTQLRTLQCAWESKVKTTIDPIVRIGLASIGSFVLIFGLWASTVPLSSAVVAVGTIVPTGQSKQLAHPTGGTVVAIHVADGEQVTKGAPILTLDPIVDAAELERLRARRLSLLANAARLESEQSGADKISFPYTVKTGELGLRGVKPSTRALELMADQTNEFNSRRKRRLSETRALRRQINALKEEITGLNGRRANQARRAASLREELLRLGPLVKQGYVSKSRFATIDREEAEVSGDIAATSAQISGNIQKIAEIESKISQSEAFMLEETSNALNVARGELIEIESQIRGAERIVDLRKLRAPVDGIVVKLATQTLGGAVGPGEPVAEIVPANVDIRAEVRIQPRDIDYLQIGQDAEIHITAFNQRLYDPIKAEVYYVSADSTVDQNTREAYFTARLAITDAASTNNRIKEIRAGMQVNAFIKADERVFLSYLMKPITDSFLRAFREH
ncbi:HlyD family type I secretion periplasmic adaptor subunit [Roseibium sp.]|uniref:HlyD family type I secretion periplasmic adaptor subunit n=1 Tax=Roseibium sp. TaxID=1936156 RepID=UPI003B50FAF4